MHIAHGKMQLLLIRVVEVDVGLLFCQLCFENLRVDWFYNINNLLF